MKAALDTVASATAEELSSAVALVNEQSAEERDVRETFGNPRVLDELGSAALRNETIAAKMSTGKSGAASLGVADLSEGDEVGYTMGAETFSPIKGNAFTVGPFSAKTRVRNGERAADAIARAAAVCGAAFQSAYELQLREHVARVNDHLAEFGLVEVKP